MTSPRPAWTRYLALYALALIPRLAYAAWQHQPFDGTYWALADGLLHDGSLSIDGRLTTDFEFGYPLFLAACRLIVGSNQPWVQAVQIAVAALGAPLMYRLTATLTRQTAAASLGAALFGVDPLLIRQAVQHSEASLTTTLLLGFTCLFTGAATTTRTAAAAGTVLGLAIATRTMLAPLVVAGALIWLAHRRYRAALVFAIAAFVVVAPFAARNARLNGSWTPTRGGANLFVGNHPYAAALLPTYDVDRLEPLGYELVRARVPFLPESVEYDRLADRILTQEAIAYMTAAPWRTAVQKLKNVLYFFSPRTIPYRVGGSAVVVTADGRVIVEGSEARPAFETIVCPVFYSLVLACAAAGMYLRRGELRADAMLWCILATFAAVYSVYFPATRYRGPMAFVLIFYAAVAVTRPAGPDATATPLASATSGSADNRTSSGRSACGA